MDEAVNGDGVAWLDVPPLLQDGGVPPADFAFAGRDAGTAIENWN